MQFIRKHRKISIIILISFCVLLIASITFGRYIFDVINNYILETKGFYFNSSILTIDDKEYSVTNWDGVNSYTLTVDLNNRKNSLVKTQADISYEVYVECSDNITCRLSKETGILYKEKDTDSYQIIITPKGEFAENEVAEVKTYVRSTSPYKKKLAATYIIGIQNANFTYEIEDYENSKYLTLDLLNSVTYYEASEDFLDFKAGDSVSLEEYDMLSDADKDKCFSAIVTLNFDPREVYLDMTASSYLHRIDNSLKTEKINNFDYVSSFSFKVAATSSVKIIFYKKDKKKDYTYPIVNEESIITVDVKTA